MGIYFLVCSLVQGGRHIAGGCYELTGHPSRGFGFQVDTTAEDCGRSAKTSPELVRHHLSFLLREIFKVISVCLDSGLPHNLVMLWGDPFGKDKRALAGQGSLDQDKGALAGQGSLIRILLVPRKPVYGKFHW